MILHIILAVVLFLIPPGILLLVKAKIGSLGSDQFYHRLLINQIELNDKKSVKHLANCVNENIMSYPQLLHLIVARIGIEKSHIFLPLLLVFVSVSQASLLSYLIWKTTSLYNLDTYTYLEYIIYSALIFVTIPYSLNLSNAKNTGISARGIGLLFGQALAVLFFLYLDSNNFYYLIGASLVGYLIITLSQFANQFHVLFSIILALTSSRFELLLSPLFSTLLAFIITPNLAFLYYKGQFLHKSLYYKYMAQAYLLKHRKSIWLDWITEFPKIVWEIFKNPISIKWKLKYIQGNALAIFLFEFWLLPIYIILTILNPQPLTTVDYLIISGIILFIATTLKFTRFLGEPERYLEFIIPFAIVSLLKFLPDNKLIILTPCIIAALVIFIKTFSILRNQKLIKKDVNEVTLFKDYLISTSGKETPTILTNSTNLNKFLFSPLISIYYFCTYLHSNDGFHFNEIFKKDYYYLSNESFLKVFRKYQNFNYLLIDEGFMPNSKSYLTNNNIVVTKVLTNKKLILYKVVR